MIWSSWSDFVQMGGYALYVWGSYAMVAAALGWEGLMLLQRRRRALRDAREQAQLQDPL